MNEQVKESKLEKPEDVKGIFFFIGILGFSALVAWVVGIVLKQQGVMLISTDIFVTQMVIFGVLSFILGHIFLAKVSTTF